MIKPMFSVVIPTVGRRSLPDTLASIPPEVEVIVVADKFEPKPDFERIYYMCRMRPGTRYLELDVGKHDTGSSQIDFGMRRAEGEYLLNFGDDDIYEPFAFDKMKRAIEMERHRWTHYDALPFMFRVALHPTWPDPRRGNRNIAVIWRFPAVIDKNITGQCFVVPNKPDLLGNWFGNVDLEFMQTTVANYDGICVFREEIIAQCY